MRRLFIVLLTPSGSRLAATLVADAAPSFGSPTHSGMFCSFSSTSGYPSSQEAVCLVSTSMYSLVGGEVTSISTDLESYAARLAELSGTLESRHYRVRFLSLNTTWSGLSEPNHSLHTIFRCREDRSIYTSSLL